MNDSYSHTASNVYYIEQNIPGPVQESESYNNLMQNYDSQLAISCKCVECSGDCPCLKLSGGNNYTSYTEENTRVKLKLNKIKDVIKCSIIECNDLCMCLENCTNRLVQKGPIDALMVQDCKNGKGLGLFTNNFITSGSFICEYAGEIISESQAIARHSANKEAQTMNYIFCLNEYCNDKLIQTFIDPTYFGNIGRYINHSCEPNCEIIPVRVNSCIPKLAIFCSQDILPGSEITFDYGCNNLNTIDTVKDKKPCLCSSQKCQGLMPYNTFS